MRCSGKVLAHPHAASPIPDEVGGDQIGVRCCQGYAQIRIPLGGGCGDSGAEEYVAQVAFRRATCPTRVASTRLQLLASRKFGFITDVKLSLTVASQMAAGGIQVTFKAQGGECREHQDWTEDDAREKQRNLRATNVECSDRSRFPRSGDVRVTRSPAFCAL